MMESKLTQRDTARRVDSGVCTEATLEALRARLERHNRRAVALAALTFVVSATLWLLAYLFLYWLTLLALTAVRGIEARPPKNSAAYFFYGAMLLTVLAYWMRRRSPDEMPRDEKSYSEHVSDIILSLPRATLAIWGNLSARQRLSRDELEVAAHLLERMQNEGPLPLHRVPLEIPEPEVRRKVLLTLKLLGLVEVSRRKETLWLTLLTDMPLALK
jgi:hypothetical protein